MTRGNPVPASLLAAALAALAAVVAPAAFAAGDGFVPTDQERARWTYFDMRSLGIALQAYHIDNGEYPGGTTIDDVVAAIAPVYIRSAPIRDAWGTPYRYSASADRSGYTLVSAGSDGVFDESTWSTAEEVDGYDQDAVLKDGEITRRWSR